MSLDVRAATHGPAAARHKMSLGMRPVEIDVVGGELCFFSPQIDKDMADAGISPQKFVTTVLQMAPAATPHKKGIRYTHEKFIALLCDSRALTEEDEVLCGLLEKNKIAPAQLMAYRDNAERVALQQIVEKLWAYQLHGNRAQAQQ